MKFDWQFPGRWVWSKTHPKGYIIDEEPVLLSMQKETWMKIPLEVRKEIKELDLKKDEEALSIVLWLSTFMIVVGLVGWLL